MYRGGEECMMIAYSFYWFLLACELAAVVLLFLAVVQQLKRIIRRF
jgi:hypothetical protein